MPNLPFYLAGLERHGILNRRIVQACAVHTRRQLAWNTAYLEKQG
jgi:hypothetical protein